MPEDRGTSLLINDVGELLREAGRTEEAEVREKAVARTRVWGWTSGRVDPNRRPKLGRIRTKTLALAPNPDSNRNLKPQP